MTEKERLQKKRLAVAAKLTDPRVEVLPSGKFRCEKMVNGKRYRVIDEDPAVAHAKINAIASGLLAAAAPADAKTFEQAYKNFVARNSNILSPSTIVGYNSIAEHHLQDFFPLRLADITPQLVQSKVNALAKTHSPKTVRNVYGLITSVYYHEYPDRRLAVNLPQKDASEIAIPTEEEIRKILDGCAGTKYELPILLAMQMGLRASEIRGLTWDCIDGDRLHINKAVVRGPDGQTAKKTKSTAGDRWLIMPARVRELIQQQPRSGPYIVPMSGRTIYGGFSRICDRAGVRHYRFHDLRHVFASVSISLNMPMEYIRRDMGHQSDNMLKHVYGHMMESNRAQYAAQREAFYAAVGKAATPTAEGTADAD